jgi:hypothetical protein
MQSFHANLMDLMESSELRRPSDQVARHDQLEFGVSVLPCVGGRSVASCMHVLDTMERTVLNM